MSTEQLVVQLDNFRTRKIRQVVPMHHHILHHRWVARDLEEVHDNLVVDMAVEDDVGLVVGDIPFEVGLEDILDYMPIVLSAAHVRVALLVGIVRIDLEVDNLVPDRIDLVVLHMLVGHLDEDMTFSLDDLFNFF